MQNDGTKPPDQNQPLRLLAAREVCKSTSLSRSTLWRLVRDGDFPPSIKISSARIAWLEHEVAAWIKNRIPADHRLGHDGSLRDSKSQDPKVKQFSTNGAPRKRIAEVCKDLEESKRRPHEPEEVPDIPDFLRRERTD